MPDSNDKILQVASAVAASFVKNYKCSLHEATEFFYNNLVRDTSITKLIENAASEKQLSKNSTFKNFVKQHKKELYYKLRQYKGNDASKSGLMQALQLAQNDPSEASRQALLQSIAAFHVSSQERLAQNELFYRHLSQLMPDVHSIVDVGCGVQPLLFPQENFPAMEKYLALDKDKESIWLLDAVKNIFKDRYRWLFPKAWNIGEGWKDVCHEHGLADFDLALILKVVPVVKRTSPVLLEQLAAIPAKTIVISGVKESMVKKQDIERKERKAIDRFIKDSGRNAIAEFELDNEFFIIVR
ncbi:MAG TPA: hypothetical protein VD993_18765 [Chitinophagaceae bacterium]|nr:hypothetical protein [Chitinophagaceae bacterium]